MKNIIITGLVCDRCKRSNAVSLMLPMKKSADGQIDYRIVDLCGPCIMKMTQHLFASKLPSKEKSAWLNGFIDGIIV